MSNCPYLFVKRIVEKSFSTLEMLLELLKNILETIVLTNKQPWNTIIATDTQMFLSNVLLRRFFPHLA